MQKVGLLSDSEVDLNQIMIDETVIQINGSNISCTSLSIMRQTNGVMYGYFSDNVDSHCSFSAIREKQQVIIISFLSITNIILNLTWNDSTSDFQRFTLEIGLLSKYIIL
jgi:hypothetical protein